MHSYEDLIKSSSFMVQASDPHGGWYMIGKVSCFHGSLPVAIRHCDELAKVYRTKCRVVPYRDPETILYETFTEPRVVWSQDGF